MAFDGITIHCIKKELTNALIGGRLYKIAQTENDELTLTIKSDNTYKLLISVNPSLPLIYLTNENKLSPVTAPNFCMLLRKHLGNGRILSITEPSLERVLDFEISHLNEMGDPCTKHLIIELMGKYSNIIFTDEDYIIIDSIKRISANISSIREVLPGRKYFIPDALSKINPLDTNFDEFESYVFTKPQPINKSILSSFCGISPIVSNNICHIAGIDYEKTARELTDAEKLHLYKTFINFFDDVKCDNYTPTIYYNEEGTPIEYSSIKLELMEGYSCTTYESISELLHEYYAKKNTVSRIRQKSTDLRKVVQTVLDRDYKKYDLQLKQLEDTSKREQYKIYGELLNTYGYNAKEGDSSLKAINYYNGEEVTIPLDKTLSPIENSKKYFEKYNKLKRTYEALSKLLVETKDEIDYLETVSNALNIAVNDDDLSEIKTELVDSGFIKRKGIKKEKARSKSKPFHYISSDGFHIYVGKNNYQNEDLSFNFANGNDMWFHAKDMPGSHVIVKTEGKELPDKTYEEAAALAAYYSKGSNQEKVEVDYTLRKNLKKPPASNPGFVIYHQNYSMVIAPSTSGLKEIN